MALLVTVFFIALATILVTQMGAMVRLDQGQSRRFSDGIQAEFVLRSLLNVAKIILELPKQQGVSEDWLGEPWALTAGADNFPIAGFVGATKLMIIDEDGKINLNGVLSSQGRQQASGYPGSPNPTAASQGGEGLQSPDIFWKNALSELFAKQGFQKELFDAKQYRTPGNVAFDASDQVAVLDDWLDSDSESFNSPWFDGRGMESGADKSLFFNRPLKHLSEVLLVPGFTVERLARIAPFVKVSEDTAATSQVNVNTAPLAVLSAIGFTEGQALEITDQRVNLPITRQILDVLVEGNTQLKRFTKLTSNEFTALARVEMPNVTRWARGHFRVSGSGTRRRANLTSIEFY